MDFLDLYFSRISIDFLCFLCSSMILMDIYMDFKQRNKWLNKMSFEASPGGVELGRVDPASF